MISLVTPGKWAFCSKNDSDDKDPYINVMGHCYTSAGFKTHFRSSQSECISLFLLVQTTLQLLNPYITTFRFFPIFVFRFVYLT